MSSTRVGDGISLELWECDGTWKNQQQNFRREGQGVPAWVVPNVNGLV
jgi:hypothetical protein